eukprot:CAMPEP_0174246080 /NCGR_PEP_ID=MMETSP0417-20130205/41892_1 /TAXON_ID=242541 /ORGANISM="Mayorella sp, Strain BSH-02190019" /LENGTH=1374 /DNA_ID=CAMNT_0015325931 /DNA_START=40 /DNA_END=4164 /DNA_ORIENTATION=-
MDGKPRGRLRIGNTRRMAPAPSPPGESRSSRAATLASPRNRHAQDQSTGDVNPLSLSSSPSSAASSSATTSASSVSDSPPISDTTQLIKSMRILLEQSTLNAETESRTREVQRTLLLETAALSEQIAAQKEELARLRVETQQHQDESATRIPFLSRSHSTADVINRTRSPARSSQTSRPLASQVQEELITLVKNLRRESPPRIPVHFSFCGCDAIYFLPMNTSLKEFLASSSKYGLGNLAPLVVNGKASLLTSFDTAVELEKPFCRTTYYQECQRLHELPRISISVPKGSSTLEELPSSTGNQPNTAAGNVSTRNHSSDGFNTKQGALLGINSRDYTDEELDQLCVNSVKGSVSASDMLSSGNEAQSTRSKSRLFKDVPLRLRWTTRHGDLVPFNVYLGEQTFFGIELKEDQTLEELRTRVASKLRSTSSNDDLRQSFFKVRGTDYLLEEVNVPLRQLGVINRFRAERLRPELSLISQNECQELKLMAMKIGHLVGKGPLSWRMGESESSDCRFRMARIIGDEKSPHNEAVLSPLSTAPLPDTFPSHFSVRVVVDEELGSKTLKIERDHTVTDVMAMVAKKIKITHGTVIEPADYAFKIVGRAEYIVADCLMNQVELVRECVKNQQAIQLKMCRRTELPRFNLPAEQRPTIEIPSLQRPDAPGMYGSSSKVSMLELKRPFEMKAIGARNIDLTASSTDASTSSSIYLEAELYHGGKLLCQPKRSSALRGNEVTWNQWLRFEMNICDIPEETRVCITLYAARDGRSDTPIANVNCRLFDFKDQFLSGIVKKKMWPDGRANPIGTCVENLRTINPIELSLGFHSYPQPVAFPMLVPAAPPLPEEIPNLSDTELERLHAIIDYDPLQSLSENNKELLWRAREYCRLLPDGKSLIKILQSVDWTNCANVRETFRLLDSWQGTLQPVDALELLDAKFAEPKVREFAVRCLQSLSDRELRDYLLQLVQVLKYEPHHFSPLACWLIQRALANQIEIGHAFFWHLQAEMHVQEISERYGVLLETYLRACGKQIDEFLAQMDVLHKLALVAGVIKDTPESRRRAVLHEQLSQLQLPPQFKVPLCPTVEAKGLVVSKCKSMDSAKAPLWLVFENADAGAPPITVMFKSGDDLRQDSLTLQMLNIMDRLWKENGLDLHLTPYGCIATGDEMGMIEVVLNSDTAANITKAAGGVKAAFKQTPLANWLSKWNPGDKYETAVENFIHSCAGYCVATYVLGIGDRHNDNIMVNRNGHLFHIDFGHFLGNVKTFAGINREKAPFVFTPEYAHVMGGPKNPNFERFLELCKQGYNILRRNANTFINLFAMMLSTGIPELQSERDIEYLRDAFALGMSEEEAGKHFVKLLYQSLNTKATQINFAIHIWAHSD